MVDDAGCAGGGTVGFTVGEALETLSVVVSTDAVAVFAAVDWDCVVAVGGAVWWVTDSAATAVCVQTEQTAETGLQNLASIGLDVSGLWQLLASICWCKKIF